MKKTYKTPLLTVNDIETEIFLCASIETELSSTEITEPSQILSKDHSFDLWAEDEE